jgi:hypothetical protein
MAELKAHLMQFGNKKRDAELYSVSRENEGYKNV